MKHRLLITRAVHFDLPRLPLYFRALLRSLLPQAIYIYTVVCGAFDTDPLPFSFCARPLSRASGPFYMWRRHACLRALSVPVRCQADRPDKIPALGLLYRDPRLPLLPLPLHAARQQEGTSGYLAGPAVLQ